MKKILIAAILAATMTLTGCSTAWVSTLDSILAAAAPALINILQIVAVVENKPMNAGLAAKVNADAATIKTLASDFANASTAAAPGVCQQLSAAIQTYSADEAQILQLAQVSDPSVQTKINLLSGLVGGTVQAILAVIPSCQSPAPAQFKAAPPLKLKTFVADYNAILVIKTSNDKVNALTPKLKLHQHSKFVRFITAGIAN